jgi:hypothetical protein
MSNYLVSTIIKNLYPGKLRYAELTDEEKKVIDKELSGVFLHKGLEVISNALSDEKLSKATAKEMMQIASMFLEKHAEFEGKNLKQDLNINISIRDLIKDVASEKFTEITVDKTKPELN